MIKFCDIFENSSLATRLIKKSPLLRHPYLNYFIFNYFFWGLNKKLKKDSNQN